MTDDCDEDRNSRPSTKPSPCFNPTERIKGKTIISVVQKEREDSDTGYVVTGPTQRGFNCKRSGDGRGRRNGRDEAGRASQRPGPRLRSCTSDYLLLTLAAGIGVEWSLRLQPTMTAPQGRKGTELSRRDIIEKLDGKACQCDGGRSDLRSWPRGSPTIIAARFSATSWRANTSTPSTTSG